MIEKILCAAIWYKDIPIKKLIKNNVNPNNIKEGLVFCGFRHCHCMYTMVSVTGLRSVENAEDGVGEEVQGFLTNKNRFVDREEAAKIAFIAGQIKEEINRLHSEDLY
jgi:hypothetical protein